MNVWLDDQRPMPEYFTHHAKTAQEAINFLKTNTVETISLDFDLGHNQPTGLEVAKFIEENTKTLNPVKIRVHTNHPQGREQICKTVQNAYQIWKEQE